jgi:glycosyltransferase involved in cell wall biosynthesis
VLTVALDATSLLGARTGIGVAVDSFFQSLSGRPEVSLTGYGITMRGWSQLHEQLPPGTRAASRPAPAGALLRIWKRAGWPPAEWWTGPVQVVHGTNFVVPPSSKASRIVSVWDLTAVRYPELVTPTSRLYPALVARAVAGGAWVHTATESVAEEIVDYFGVEPARVKVVPPALRPPPPAPAPGLAAAPDAAAPEATAPEAPDAATPAPPPYILGLGRTEPRKDFPGLVRAFDILAGRQPGVELRIAGPPGWAETEVQAAIAASSYRDRIRREGWVGDVAGLIAGASVFAYPSLYEGFGLPPLEAMAAGVPVVAASAGAVPEVVGPAAVLVAPGDVEALAGALERVLTDQGLRRQLVVAGRDRAALFSSERTAQGLIAAYREVAGVAASAG